MMTVTSLLLPGLWMGTKPSTACPLQVTEATPFSTPFGFWTVMWYSAPRQTRVTRNCLQSAGTQGSRSRPPNRGRTPRIYRVAAK